MSSGINKCIFIGNLGKDPEEMRNDNNSRTTFSMAVSESWKDKITGERKEATEWINFVAFGKPAEIIGKYAKKGDKLYVDGKFQTRKFQNDAGETKYYTEIMVREFQFLSSKGDRPAQSEDQSQQVNQSGYQQGAPAGFDDSDLPF